MLQCLIEGRLRVVITIWKTDTGVFKIIGFSSNQSWYCDVNALFFFSLFKKLFFNWTPRRHSIHINWYRCTVNAVSYTKCFGNMEISYTLCIKYYLSNLLIRNNHLYCMAFQVIHKKHSVYKRNICHVCNFACK